MSVHSSESTTTSSTPVAPIKTVAKSFADHPALAGNAGAAGNTTDDRLVRHQVLDTDDFIQTLIDRPVLIDVKSCRANLAAGLGEVTVLNAPEGGSAKVSAEGEIVFHPSSGFVGLATIHYMIEDQRGEFSEATVTIEVQSEFAYQLSGVNRQPTMPNVPAKAKSTRPQTVLNAGLISEKIYTLVAGPVFRGFARPRVKITGSVYEQSGALAAERTTQADANGQWQMQFSCIGEAEFCRVEFSLVADDRNPETDGGRPFLGLTPDDFTYQSLRPVLPTHRTQNGD